MKRNILVTLFCLVFGFCLAQPFGVLTHFSHDVKLSQSRILDIQQDKKGFIWLGTFNGLIRYDGSSFRNFKVAPNDSLRLISNRVSKFKFDKNGRIWIQSEKNDIYYFDTNKLSFHYPLEGESNGLSAISLKEYKMMSSGRVWLFPENKNYLIAFETNKQIRKIHFNPKFFSGRKIADVFEDKMGTTWFLTDAGICRLKKEATDPEYFFFNMSRPNGETYSYIYGLETKNEIWFGGAKGKLTRYSKQSSTFFDVQLGIKEDIVRMEFVGDSKLLILSGAKEFYCYDINNSELDVYNSKTLVGLPNEKINYIGLTGARQFWFETLTSGVYKFDFVTRKLKSMRVESNYPATVGIERKTFLLTAPNGRVWIQSKKGPMAYWDEKQDKLTSIAQCTKEYKKEASDVMHTAMFDQLGNLWFCSYKQGLDLMTFNNSNFLTLSLDISSNGQKHNVRSLMEDKNGTLWVASRSNKITLIDSKKKKIGLLGSDGTLSVNSPGWGADIYNMVQDNKGQIWIGTRGNGLFCLLPTEKPFNYKVSHYKFNENDKYSISSDNICKIFQASTGRVYVGTWGGGINLIQQSNDGIRFLNYRNELKNYPIKSADKVRSIAENKEGKMFFTSSYKLFSFSEEDQPASKLEFKEFPQVSGNDILDFMITSDNRIALATNGKGMLLADLDKKGTLKVKSWNETVDFPIEGVVAMQEDKSGEIWLMGDNQIVRFNPKKNSAETFPELKSIIGTEIFSEATSCRLSNGEIVLGYSDGVIYFDPKAIKPLTFKPYLAISSFTVNNRELHEIKPEVPSNPDLLEKVTLKYNENFFRIQFSALDYIKNDNIVYRYKLEGVDNEWNYIKGGQSINYTNLSRGNYTLVISSTNSHNLWVANERRIEIIIRPSIWWTNLAYVCYILLAIGLFILVRRTVLTIMKLRNDVQMKEQMAELKLKFFTDISHEIRTPLTMITAPVEKMLSDNTIAESVKIQLQGIERNSNRLLNLVNQILDLRRIQNRRLSICEINLGDFVTKLAENFREMSLHRKINLVIKTNVPDIFIWADLDSLDKILVNLISNAFKYCHEGDTIEVIVEELDKQVVLKVKDNGPGISPLIQKRLFIRFSNYNENPNNPSTGIGLSIVKDLVDKHGANITVDTELGKGSCFELCFLKGYQHFDEDVDIMLEEFDERLEDITASENRLVLAKSDDSKKGKPVGLIVEDDPELRAFIVSILEDEYTIHVAENGIEGHLKTASLSPDFVISDIMMAQMDGVEMLKLIRNNFATSHIPVILLSAKTSIESRLEGIDYGADEYLTKPFNVSYLKARVKNILEQRKRLQFLYSNGNIAEIPVEESLQISNQDHKFMFQVIQLVKDNLSKTDFSVDELGKLMCMSRASFFNKLKDLTGMSPVVFIRDMRLNYAADMLKKEDLLIKEICFEVGFNDLKYFGKCFKLKFNLTPAEYRRLYR